MSSLLLVDLENVQKLDLAMIPANVRVLIFYGQTQRKLPDTLVKQAQPLGARLQWIHINGQGSNALDFHIAFYLGQELTTRPHTACVILSGDTGFDPLVRHLIDLKHHCKRVTTLKAAFPGPARNRNPLAPPAPTTTAVSATAAAPAPAPALRKPAAKPATPEPYAKLLAMLASDKSRPRKRKGLAGKVKSCLPKLTPQQHEALLARLFAEGRVRETPGSGVLEFQLA